MTEETSTSMTRDVEETQKTVENSRAPTVPQAHPWLLIHHGQNDQCQTFYSISRKRCYRTEIHELSNKYICNSSVNGWLVVEHNDSDDFFLFNLASEEKIQLPQLEQPYSICVLTSVPSDPDCLLLFVSKSGTSVMFYRPGRPERAEGFDQEDLDGHITRATSVQGKIYCLVVARGLALLDFSGSRPRLVDIIDGFADTSLGSLSINCATFLVESGGELLYVTKLYYGLFSRQQVLALTVHRADLSLREWIEVEDIAECAIFLDLQHGLCFNTSQVEEGCLEFRIRRNSIYFVEPNDRCLYAFDLKGDKTVGCLPSDQVSTYSVRRWIMMSS